MAEVSKDMIADMLVSLQSDVSDIKLDVRESLCSIGRIEERFAALVASMDAVAARDADAIGQLGAFAGRSTPSI